MLGLKFPCFIFQSLHRTLYVRKGIWILKSENSFCLQSGTYSDSSSVYFAIDLGSIFFIGLKETSLKEIKTV